MGIRLNIGGLKLGSSSGSSWTPQSLVVENAQPTKVVMTSTKADTSLVASDFTIAGFTVSSLARDATNKILTLTLSTAVVYGDVLNVVFKGTSYPVTNNIAGIGFITEWTVSGDATARTITLPLVNTRTEGALAYDCIIDWGDGTATSHVTAYNDAARAHTYAANGTYQVNITGTCEGWSFNNAGDKLKITKVINWGTAGVFNGFKYLYRAFYGCTNLTSLGTGKILASGTGVLTQGFAEFCFNCNALTAIPAGLFDNHTSLTTTAFQSAFNHCIAITEIPADLFKYNTLVTTYAFSMCFFQCTSLVTVPADLFRYNTSITIWGFNQTFRECSSIVTLPNDLFRYNTTCTTYAFRDTFQGCSSLSAIPQDIFRYNINVSTHSFEGTFITCTSLTTLPTDLFRYNTLADNFFVTFQGCSNLETLCPDLFRYNLLVTTDGFEGTFKDCVKLQLRSDIFGPDLTTRFLYAGVSDFNECFDRASFSGTQGTAPDLWNATFPEVWEVSVRPAVAWVEGDIITGQTSGVTGTFYGWYGTWKILLKDVTGNYTSDEIIGVTGVPTKLANQGVGYPIETSPLISTNCFNGAGNSLTSISNYASIPAPWL
jgi:hypothetical protein